MGRLYRRRFLYIVGEAAPHAVAAGRVPPEPPVRLRMLDLRGGKPAITSFAAFAGGKARVRREDVSGAVYLSSVQRPSGVEKPLAKDVYVQRANSLLRELGWQSNEVGEPVVTPIMTASMPVGGGANEVREAQKSVLITYPRQIEVEGQKIAVLDGGGRIRVSMSNDGTVLHASRVWRQLQTPSASVHIKTFEQARDEATRKLTGPDAYKLDQWRWGYKELAGNAKQDNLPIVFQFAFVPKDPKDLLQHPPQIIEVSGEVD